ncbi:hypothetical protein MAHJHV55_08100 [Mycobacterium avium subsp. hominissuis]
MLHQSFSCGSATNMRISLVALGSRARLRQAAARVASQWVQESLRQIGFAM